MDHLVSGLLRGERCVMTSRIRRSCATAVFTIAVAALLALPGIAAAAIPGYFGVDFIGATSGWVVGSDATVLSTVTAGKTWQTQTTTPGGATLLDVCVLSDGKTGWAVGAGGTVLRTTDGKTWTKVFSSAFNSTYSFTSVKFVDQKNGWIAGGVAAGTFQGTPAGAILRTSDGGLTWQAAAVSAGWCPISLDAVSATSALCAGIQRVGSGVNGSNAPAAVRTTDGTTWTAPALLRPAVRATGEVGGVAMFAAKASAAAVIVGDYCELLPPTPFAFSSTTAGAAWKYVAGSRTGPSQLRGVCLSSAAAGLAVGSGSAAVLKTSNGGSSWSAVSAPLAKNLYAVDLAGATGYAVGRTSAGKAATVLKTTNGGSGWTTVK
jgi:photosystem II stability/assembly factor-like uncharacterized protein